jgi:hypothetical protein
MYDIDNIFSPKGTSIHGNGEKTRHGCLVFSRLLSAPHNPESYLTRYTNSGIISDAI